MTQKLSMDDLLAASDSASTDEDSDVREGTVIAIKKNEVLVDMGPSGVGVVPRREIIDGQAKEGEPITVSIVQEEVRDGVTLLSMRKAMRDRGWDDLVALRDAGDVVEVTVGDANRGGLLIEYLGVRGFMPVSQLSTEHYPRVSGADKDEILARLLKLKGETIKAVVLDASKENNKLIFSEKEAMKGIMKEAISSMKVGDDVEGEVTGVVDFGAFINVDGIEGLVHISEISWDRVEDPREYVKVGDSIKTKIVGIDENRLSLSIKQLQDDPWKSEVKKYKKGDSVNGKITRITPFGAFIQLSSAVEALVHVSELGDDKSINPEEVFKLGETKEFKIIDIDEEMRKVSLSLS